MNLKEWLKLFESNEGAGANFKRWYDANRGSWADVERLAAKSPQVKAFVDRIDNEVQFGKFDRFADPLQRFVNKYIPSHSKHDVDKWDRDMNPSPPAWKHLAPGQQQHMPKTDGPLQHDNGTTGAWSTPDAQQATRADNGATGAWSSQANSQVSSGGNSAVTVSLQNHIQDHEARLRSLESLFQQMKSGTYGRQSA